MLETTLSIAIMLPGPERGDGRWRGAWMAVAAVALLAGCGAQGKEAPVNRRTLTPEEQRILLRRETEPPFSGRYWNHHEKGTYHCRLCGAPLFPSSAKFDSGTGWPSFEQALEGAVREVPDPDGERVEIVCARCGAHLGHVFRGEGFTPRQTRHCVNSASLDFDPE